MTTKTKNRPLWAVDTCVFVNILTGGKYSEQELKWLDRSKSLIDAAASEAELAISSLTIAELFGTSKIRQGSKVGREYLTPKVKEAEIWLDRLSCLVVETTEPIARKAAALAIECGLRGADAVIVASAHEAGAEVLYTWDDKLIKKCPVVGSMMLKNPPQREYQLPLSFDSPLL